MTAHFASSKTFLSYRRPLVVAVLLLLALGGCRGCRQETAEEKAAAEKRAEEERAKKEREKPREDFECKGPICWPCGRYSTIESEQIGVSNYLKPGHWTSIVLADAKMNNFDFAGDWEISLADRRQNAEGPVSVPATPYTVKTTRQVLLAKGQAKTLQSLLLVPAGQGHVSMTYQLRGRRLIESGLPLALMPSYQYHFVVLSRRPVRYTYLSGLDSIRPRHDSIAISAPAAHYRVTLAPPGRQPPLPSYASLWTSIAYVLWDDADPTLLDADQQQAMLDWLHWGGQLILSGPDTLDGLRGSFLAPYLPATSAGERKLRTSDLAELSKQWSGLGGRGLDPVKPWVGIRLQLDPRAQFLPDTGDLLAERAVGRGRIVVSAFRLYGPGLDLLAGMGRRAQWLPVAAAAACPLLDRDRTVPTFTMPTPRPIPIPATPRSTAACVSSPATRESRGPSMGRGGRATSRRRRWLVAGAATGSHRRGDDPPELEEGEDLEPPTGPGVAAWNDFNPVANAARQSLQEAAGIKVLDRMFVVWILVGYVRGAGAVELVVFPLAGPRGMGLGRRAADRRRSAPQWSSTWRNLDIGFVRAQNEIAVVELQNDYPRRHVTRYMALYTSLATGYDFHFDSPGALLLPFPTTSDPGSFRMMLGESYRNVTYRRGSDADVDGFAVGSNSIGFVHGEHWIDLASPLVITKQEGDAFQIANQTQFTLRDAGVMKRTASGGLQTAWLGTIAAGASAAGEFRTGIGGHFRRPTVEGRSRPLAADRQHSHPRRVEPSRADRNRPGGQGPPSRRDPPGGLVGRRAAGTGD